MLFALFHADSNDSSSDDTDTDTQPEDTDDILGRAIAGDKEAMGALYEQHQDAIYRYFYYRVGNQQAADDLTSDVFVSMIEALPGYEQRGLPFRAWLFRIARNRAVDYYRKQSRYKKSKLTDNLAAPDRPAIKAQINLTTEALQRALDFLNDDQRNVFIMRIVLEMSIAETAQALDKTESSVKGLQHRGLIALRRALSDQQ